MNHNDDGYAAMLLTMALSPDREEYARPYSAQELTALENAVRNTAYRRIGKLLNLDISGLMIYLDMSEEAAYRAYTLLHRTVQLSYALEGFARQGIEVITGYDGSYPARLKRKLSQLAPPFFYCCGSDALLSKPAVAILGIGGVKTGADVREAVAYVVENAVSRGYTIITGGEMGVSRMAATLAVEKGGCFLDVLGGGLRAHIDSDGVAEWIALERAAVIATEHPDAMFTLSHGVARNRIVFSLADAAFVFNTDGRRGEAEALQNRYCDWIYAWEGCPQNQPLFARGAIPMGDLKALDFDRLCRHWNSSAAEQINMFDLF